jgi:hypothetical protein
MSKRRYKRMSPTEWAQARAFWETGEITLEELAVRFDVTQRALQAHFRKHSTIKGSKAKELATAVQEAVFADIFEDPVALRAKGRDARSAAFENAGRIERLVMAQVDESLKDPANAYRAASAIRALSLAAQAIERTHKIRWAALGLDQAQDSEELPELIIRDLTEEELSEIRREQSEAYDNGGQCAAEEEIEA